MLSSQVVFYKVPTPFLTYYCVHSPLLMLIELSKCKKLCSLSVAKIFPGTSSPLKTHVVALTQDMCYSLLQSQRTLDWKILASSKTNVVVAIFETSTHFNSPIFILFISSVDNSHRLIDKFQAISQIRLIVKKCLEYPNSG